MDMGDYSSCTYECSTNDTFLQDLINIKHLKHQKPLGLIHLTQIFILDPDTKSYHFRHKIQHAFIHYKYTTYIKTHKHVALAHIKQITYTLPVTTSYLSTKKITRLRRATTPSIKI